MSSEPSPKIKRATNELAKERNHAAAERTLTTWIQTCLSLISFGIAFEQIFSAINRSFPENSLIYNVKLTQIISLNAIAIGIFLLVIAIFGYLSEIKSLQQEDYLPPRLFYTALIGSVVLLGFVTFVIGLIVPY
jgi:putative membrane protein